MTDTPTPQASSVDVAPVWLVHTTLPSEAQAQQMAQALVEAGLAACVQVQALHSSYGWQGQVCTEPEWQLSIKTLASNWPMLRDWLRQHHPYELPELIALPLVAGDAAYLQWVADNSQPRSA